MFDFPAPQFFHLPNGTTKEQGETVVHRKAAGADSLSNAVFITARLYKALTQPLLASWFPVGHCGGSKMVTTAFRLPPLSRPSRILLTSALNAPCRSQ